MANRLVYEPIDLAETKKFKLNGTPLWFYILEECFFTVMREDDWSYLKLHPRWKPNIGKDIGDFEFTDLLRFVEGRVV